MMPPISKRQFLKIFSAGSVGGIGGFFAGSRATDMFRSPTAARTPAPAVGGASAPIDSVAIVAHETPWTMKLLSYATQSFQQVCFVPLRENVQQGGTAPTAPQGVTVLRGDDKFTQLLSRKPQGVLTFGFQFGTDLAGLDPADHPRVVMLMSKTSLDHHQATSDEAKAALSGVQVISFWHSRLKRPDSYHGVGQSMVRVMDKIGAGSDRFVVVAGYGNTGKGIARYLQQHGYEVGVVDTDPVEILLAQHDGFEAGLMQAFAGRADVVIDATDGLGTVLDAPTADAFRGPTVTVLSSSSDDTAIQIADGYVNASGTRFIVHASGGMANMHHGVGGNDDQSMMLTGHSGIHTLRNFPNIATDPIPDNPYVTQLSAATEREIAASAIKDAASATGNPLMPTQ